MGGCSFGDVSPVSFPEIIISLIIFIVGASVLAKVFSDFASLMHLLTINKIQEG